MSSTAPTTATGSELLSSPNGDLAVAEQHFNSLLTPPPEHPEEENEQLDLGLPSGEPEIESEVEDSDVSLETQPDEVDDDSDEVDDYEDEEQPGLHRVKVNGEHYDVSLDDLKQSYSRHSDYTQKTQSLAEDKKRLDEELAALGGERAQYAEVLQGLQQKLSATGEVEPDWETLQAEDPVEFGIKWATHQRKQQQLAAINQEQNRLYEIDQQERVQQYGVHLSEQVSLLKEKIPEWKDDEIMRLEKAEMVKYGKTIGLSDEQLGNFIDHRSVMVLRDSWKLNKLSRKTKNATPTDTVKTMAPGSSRTAPRPKSEFKRAKQKLKKTGNTADLARVYEVLISD